jgi:hypothetical protein
MGTTTTMKGKVMSMGTLEVMMKMECDGVAPKRG